MLRIKPHELESVNEIIKAYKTISIHELYNIYKGIKSKFRIRRIVNKLIKHNCVLLSCN